MWVQLLAEPLVSLEGEAEGIGKRSLLPAQEAEMWEKDCWAGPHTSPKLTTHDLRAEPAVCPVLLGRFKRRF